jgi:16S rRNA (guanine527-N7)-methyltransferase
VESVLDLGSGNGFPGIPLAVAVPLRRVLLVESVGRKGAFLRAAAAALTGQLPTFQIAVAQQRAESLARDPRHRAAWPAVTARAVGSVADLVELAFPLLGPGGCLVAWKRGDIDAELAAAARAVSALGGGAIDVFDVSLPDLAGHRLVTATRTGTVPAEYPREPARRRRQPW